MLPLRLSFFPRWDWHHHPRIQIIQKSRDSDRQCFFSLCSVHWRCKKGKTLDFHDKVFLLRSFEIAFYPIIRDLSASAPQIWYANLFAKPYSRYQPLRANSKRSNNFSIGRETAAVGSSCLAAATTMSRPYDCIHGSVGCWSELVFSLPLVADL